MIYVYMCNNNVIHLFIYFVALSTSVPPSIRVGESEVSVVENTQALLTCVADGVPQPTITWEKDDIALADTTGEYTILPTGELLIDTAQVRVPIFKLLAFRVFTNCDSLCM